MITVTDAQIQAWLGMLLWPFFRILALFAADPFYSSRSIPVRVKVGLAFMLAMLIAPALPAGPDVAPVSPLGLLILAQQLLIGFAIGMTMRLVFSSVEMAGHLAGLQMGLGFASFYDPQHGTNTVVVAQFASLLTILLFLSFNGHLLVIETIVKSFTLLPISAVPLKTAGLKLLVDSAGQIFTLGLLLSLPVLAALLITNLSIGVMSRAAPQFNVFAVGFPLTLGVGVGAFYLSLPHFSPHVQRLIDEATRLAYKVARVMAG
ncbi:flagellar biosynthetic protein FliR [Chitinimonas arctica]|uniref:Flagellar biosynthetic protein FliR n=1 Tax=Chitinimonas arctica TaxID=2594795 RepID=A0A516SKY1_9NEIS|nr:flagellar biosynthetic protein FliR [Chitinimonas arctica]QDQ28678.1 flagellar biosynthetic protein FliR [Chitinimonas arctica]